MFRLADRRNVTRASRAGIGRSIVSAAVASYEKIKDLPLEIDSYELEGREFHPEGTEFDRLTTTIEKLGTLRFALA